MKNIWKLSLLCSALAFVSCDRDGVNETVESAYTLPIPIIPEYKFSRNGASSVDITEPTLLEEPLYNVYSRYMKDASIINQTLYDEVWTFYNDGWYSYIPANNVATSPIHSANQSRIRTDITNMIETSARISGYGATIPSSVRNRKASSEQTGYIGVHSGDVNIAYADEKGIIVAEAFDKMITGAIHLDKIINFHLDESILNDATLRSKHETLELLQGKNYTELEHHWDLAYGYYNTRWKALTQAEGVPALKNSEDILNYAFYRGRYEMGKYNYDEMLQHAKTIRQELSRVLAIRTMNLLTGVNTFANLQEYSGYAFPSISQAYGFVYTLQFTRDANGKPYFTYDQVSEMLNQLTANTGLWEQQRLLGSAEIQGSLRNIATQVGKPFGISLQDIER